MAEGDFMTRVRITGGESAHVGVNLQAYDKVGSTSLFVMKVNDGIQFKGWGFGWNSDDSGYNYINWKNADEKKDFYFTVVRYDGKLYVFIGDENESRLIRVFEGNIKGNESTVNTASLGKLRIGFGIFGNSATKTVTFSDYSFSTETADIDAALGVVEVTGTVADSANGTVTATAAVGGATYSASVVNGAYTIKVGKNSTYKLYFDCGDKEGLVTSVAVGETVVTAANATLAQKVNFVGIGDTAGTATLTATGTYSVTDNGKVNGNGVGQTYSFGGFGTTSGDFKVSAKILNGDKRHIGVALRYGDNKYLAFIKAGASANICAYDGESWSTTTAVDWTNGNKDDYNYTVVKKDDSVTVYVNDVLIATYSDVTIGSQSYSVGSLGEVQVGLALCWTTDRSDGTSATFTDYSYTTDSTEINDYVTAHNA